MNMKRSRDSCVSLARTYGGELSCLGSPGMSQRSIDARLEISAGNQEAVTLLRRITNCDSRPASAGTVLVSTVNSCAAAAGLCYETSLHSWKHTSISDSQSTANNRVMRLMVYERKRKG